MSRNNAVCFGMGVVTGCAVTALFFLFKEGVIFVGDGSTPIHSTVEPSANEYDSPEKPIPFKDAQPQNNDHVIYNDILRQQEYAAENEAKLEPSVVSQIFEEDFFDGQQSHQYDSTELTLYSDGFLADSASDRVMDSDDLTIALAMKDTSLLKQKFENGADILYFRNERLSTQYEINYDEGTYKEITGDIYGVSG